MPVNSTIPIPADFLQTTGTYPLLTELIQHPTNGYLYGCYTEAGVGKILKLKNDDYTDATVASLPVTAPIDMHYSATNDRFYVVYRTTNSPVTEVHPTTLAMVAFFSITSVGGQGAITGDTANLYVATFSTQKLYSISLATGLQVGLRTMPATGYAKINCLRYFSPKLYALSMDVDYVQLSRIVPATLGTEEVSTPIGIDAGEVPVDDMGESASHIYVGNRDLLGIIRKFSKTDFLNPELIETTQLSKCTCVKTVGPYVWAAFENGRGVRINSANIPDRRIYTLNDGEGYHSEFTGLGSEFVHTYNLSASKIQRYHIPPDVVAGATEWAMGQYASPNGYRAHGLAVAVDGNGNIAVAGEFNNVVTFATGQELTSEGSFDGALAKYDSAGSFLWAKQFGDSFIQMATSVVFDSDGNIIVAGRFANTVDFGNGFVLSTPAFGAAENMFIAKYSSGSAGVPGTCLWAKNYGGTANDAPGGVAVDSSGSIIVVGKFSGTNIDFGNGYVLSSSGSFEMVILKLDPTTGATIWAVKYGTAATEDPKGVAIDSNGDIAVCGIFANGPTNLGGNTIGVHQSNTPFVAKYSGTDGSHLWSMAFGGNDVDRASSVSIDLRNNDVIVTGMFKGTVHFDGGSTTNSSTRTSPGVTVFIAGYTSSGTFRWVNTIGPGSGSDSSNGISRIDSNGRFAIAGQKNGEWTINGITYRVDTNGFYVLFCQIATAGNEPVITLPKFKEAGSVAGSFSNAVALSAQGKLIATGVFNGGIIKFGNNHDLTTTASSYSGFLVQYTS